jgi:hypothetical protein
MTRLLPNLHDSPRLRRDDYVGWAMGAMAFTGLLFNGFALLSVFGGGPNRQDLPFVLPGAPFGSYAQNTQLGILALAGGFALLLAGAILAFRWQRIAARTLIAGGAVHLFLLRIQQLDPTRPHDHGLIVMTIVFAVAPFALASLLLVVSRRKVVGPAASGSVEGV